MPFKRKETADPAPVFHCIICAEVIPPERVVRRASTCCDAHAVELKNKRRRMRDAGVCRLCRRPNTPEERADYAAWRAERLKQKREAERNARELAKEAERAAKKQQEPNQTPLEEHLGTVVI